MTAAPRPKLPKGVARNAMQDLGRAIVRGEFPPGAVLPTEEALAARTGASRPALREAIKVLSGKGLVRTARRYGSRVCPQPEWNFLDPDVLVWHLAEPANWPQFLTDFVEMRLTLEPVAASLAALRATEEEVRQILHHAHGLPVVVSEVDVDADVAFHAAVLRATHNTIFAGLAPSMDVLMRAYFAAIRTLRPEAPRNVPTTNLHAETADAIARRDAAAARSGMERMLGITHREVEYIVGRFRAELAGTGPAAGPSPLLLGLHQRMAGAYAALLA